MTEQDKQFLNRGGHHELTEFCGCRLARKFALDRIEEINETAQINGALYANWKRNHPE